MAFAKICLFNFDQLSRRYHAFSSTWLINHIDGLVQVRRNSTANAL